MTTEYASQAIDTATLRQQRSDEAPVATTSPVRPTTRRGAREVRALLGLGLLSADALVLAVACAAALAFRQNMEILGSAPGLPMTVLHVSLAIGGGWLLALLIFGAYDARVLPAGPEMYRNVTTASLAAVGIVGATLYLSDVDLSRPFFVVLFLIGPALLLLVRLVARRLLNRARAHGRLGSRVLVVGSRRNARGISRTLQRESWLGYEVMGAVGPAAGGADALDTGIPVLGAEEDLLSVVLHEQPDVVLFAAGSSATAEDFRRVAWELEELEVEVIVVPALSEISGDRISMRPVAGLPLVHMDLPRSRDALAWTKRLFDVAGSALLLLALSPVLVVVAMAVKLGDGGPVVFRQERVGRAGEPFEFLKFRSMVLDAEERRVALEGQDRDRGNVIMFKMADDPRITRVGKVLRRYSLDELPQLWNVLRGDMSLIGPRPALPREVQEYDADARRRLAVRPGITGLWQVSGRSDLSWDETVRLDLFYVDNWSFTQDLQILVRTLRAVLASRGAY
ncbi:sugar transferase [Brachybacterium squillarum]|uniref:sugar transferase n=1 Tax=Brachybacterium squillarum TaxID=661979 RepID=UPI002221C2AF|nr:sugar transferase [Brachybacterium squillarum]MCW1803790.1 sugar transferase [Brachybacterium squillarum]